MWSTTLVGAAVAALLAVPVVTAAPPIQQRLDERQQQDKGTPLYLDEPSCDFFQCAITWYPGDHVSAHWLDAPAGNVLLDLMTNASTVLAHHVATVPGTTTNCDAEGEGSCGQFSWVVPSDWVGGNFSLRASSESDPSIESYTDVILVKPPNGTATSSVAFSALDPTATSSGNSSAPSSSGAPAGTPAPTASSASNTNGSSSDASSSSRPASSSTSGTNAVAGTHAGLQASLVLMGTVCAAAALML